MRIVQQHRKTKQAGKLKKPGSSSSVFTIPGLKLSHFLFIAVILGALTLVAFYPSLRGEFTNWDDNQYVTANPKLEEFSLSYAAKTFSRFELGNYHPLTMISLSMNYKEGSPEPFPFHCTSLILHFLNILLVYLLIRKMKFDDITAVVTAVLFAVQATRVESVAWISARKEVLYAFFFLLSILTYLIYCDKGKGVYLLLSIVFFLLSLLSKATAVVLAPMLILLDLYLGRGMVKKRVILEKIPFFILAATAGIIAVLAQQNLGAIQFSPPLTLPFRLVMAAGSLMLYLQKLIIPAGLNAFYQWPLTPAASLRPEYYLYALLFLTVCIGFIYVIRKSWPSDPRAVGFLFFTLGLLPLLQVIAVGNAAMADRYVYIPGIGIFLLIGTAVTALYRKRKLKLLLSGAGLVVVFLLVTQTRTASANWQNSLSLWNSVLRKNPGIAFAYTMRGYSKETRGDYDGAIEDYAASISRDSLQLAAFNNRAVLYAWRGNFSAAEDDLRAALRNDPDFALTYANLGFVMTRAERYIDALPWLDKAIMMNPNDPMALGNRGYCHFRSGELTLAQQDLDHSLSVKPDNPFACFYRAQLQLARRDTVAACNDYEKAVTYGFLSYVKNGTDSVFRIICNTMDSGPATADQ